MILSEIYNNILNGLSNNIEEDIIYLKEKSIEYLEHEDSVEISKFIGKLVLDILSRKNEMTEEEAKERAEEINKLFNEAKNLVNEKKLLSAKPIIEQAIQLIPNKSKGGIIEFSFASPVELSLFVHTFKPQGDIHHSLTDNSSIYMLYGFILAQSMNVPAAITALEEALKWNPVNVNALMELAEINRLKWNDNKFLNLIRNALNLALNCSEISRCYYMLGDYYRDKKDYEACKAFYLMSKSYCETTAVLNELNKLYINYGMNVTEPSLIEIKKVFKEKNIQYGASNNVINSIEAVAKEAKNNDSLMLYKYCKEIYFNLTSRELKI